MPGDGVPPGLETGVVGDDVEAPVAGPDGAARALGDGLARDLEADLPRQRREENLHGRSASGTEDQQNQPGRDQGETDQVPELQSAELSLGLDPQGQGSTGGSDDRAHGPRVGETPLTYGPPSG